MSSISKRLSKIRLNSLLGLQVCNCRAECHTLFVFFRHFFRNFRRLLSFPVVFSEISVIFCHFLVNNASTTLIDYIAFKVCNFDFKVCILILIFVILILKFAIAKQSSATLSLHWWTNPTSQIEFSPRKFEWCPTWWYLR